MKCIECKHCYIVKTSERKLEHRLDLCSVEYYILCTSPWVRQTFNEMTLCAEQERGCFGDRFCDGFDKDFNMFKPNCIQLWEEKLNNV